MQVQFHVHALELFPDGPDKFYEELVWTFHQVNKMSNTPIPEYVLFFIIQFQTILSLGAMRLRVCANRDRET